jgi:cytochrome c-type biogenesis protein CcmH
MSYKETSTVKIQCLWVVILTFFISSFSMAEERYPFEKPKQYELFKELLVELRCPKCQNQNLMDSNSDISSYMKQRVYIMVKEGHSKDDIVTFLKQRYGDFITYDPPLNIQTAVLWFVPIFVLLIACGMIALIFRSREQS